jgi:hypothetical protein
MLRQLVRTGILAAALVSALAFSGSALAGPTKPNLDPIPNAIFGSSLNVKWSPSVFSPGAFFKAYKLDVRDVTAGTPPVPHTTTLTQFQLNNLVTGHLYVLELQAWEVDAGFQVSDSASDFEVFRVYPSLVLDDLYWREIRFPPEPPWCLTCPYFLDLIQHDPVLRAGSDRLRLGTVGPAAVGVSVDGRGEVTGLYR